MQHDMPPAAPAADGFLPHGYCYLWNTPLLATHVISDLLIGLSYVAISLTLVYLVHRARRDIPFSVIFIAFGLFIVACGATHFVEIWTLWQPVYWLAGGVKVVTAVASVSTAAVLPTIVPKVRLTIQDAKRSRARELAAERAAALEESNELLHAQAMELEQQTEEAQALAEELEQANAELLVATRAADEARNAAERARAEVTRILESIADAFFAVDRDWRFTYVNARAAELLRQPREALLGQTAWSAFPELAGSALERDLRRAAADGTTLAAETLSPTLGAWLDVRAYPADGGLSVYLRDVTERRRAEDALHLRDRAVAAATEGITIADVNQPDAPIIYVNPEFERITGYAAAEVVGRNCRLLQGPGTEREPVAELRRAIADGRPCSVELLNYRRDGTPFWNALSIAPVHDAAGALTHYVGIQRDVTSRRRADTDLREALAAAEMARAHADEANRAKSEFLTVMSHELRTPLNAVGGFAELLELGVYGPVTEQQLDALGRIRRSQQHLLMLITNILNFARIEAGRVDYRLEPLPLGEIVQGVTTLVEPQIRAKGLSLTVEPCAAAALGDGEKLRQILINLLSNAVKFTDRGGHIAVTCVADAQEVAVHVADSGRGIPAEKRERVFEPFVQLDQRLTRTAEGTGLGLAIARDLARGMGGDITMESEPGVGSTFTVSLPRALASG